VGYGYLRANHDQVSDILASPSAIYNRLPVVTFHHFAILCFGPKFETSILLFFFFSHGLFFFLLLVNMLPVIQRIMTQPLKIFMLKTDDLSRNVEQ